MANGIYRKTRQISDCNLPLFIFYIKWLGVTPTKDHGSIRGFSQQALDIAPTTITFVKGNTDMNNSATRRRLADWFFRLRNERGQSITEVAEGTGVSRATLYRLENGESSLKMDHFESLCAFHKVSPADFWCEQQAKKEEEVPAAPSHSPFWVAS